jgi:hypothetical protein
VDQFPNDREALDFIASRIADEAQRDGTPLSEVERKMLYFSETAWTLPDIMEVNDEFDRHYEQDAYEEKISQLIKKAVGRTRERQEEFEAWTQAIRRLSKEDRYLLVMVEKAGLIKTFRHPRPPGDSWKLLATGFALAVFTVSASWMADRYFDWELPSRYSLAFFIWAVMACAAVTYGLLLLLAGPQKTFRMMVRVFEWFLGTPKPGK